MAKGATLYVNLEPCAHQGKTPPCADAIVKAGIAKVVSASEDPNPLVAGRGFRKLRSAGIAVTVGVMRHEAREINERFFGFMERGIPFVGAKVAQTIDGKTADYRGASKWITSVKARAYGHYLRSLYDAVLVGASTVRKDDPLLTVRAVKGRNPVRVVVDGELSVPLTARMLRNSDARSIVLTSGPALRRRRTKALQLEKRGIAVLGIGNRGFIRPADILKVLSGLGISSVLIEGGANTIRPFMESGALDKIHCFIAPKILGGGMTGLDMRPLGIQSAVVLKNPKVTLLGPDLLIEGTLK
jgi:diaminohydroxyphosphoribosylaminopyrimidine deaminase/5-amino-6-(5-phosphoribosylamino)uracil reductase